MAEGVVVEARGDLRYLLQQLLEQRARESLVALGLDAPELGGVALGGARGAAHRLTHGRTLGKDEQVVEARLRLQVQHPLGVVGRGGL